ncbi:MAG: GntR family transcriptional regulator [Alphaproteobacteria bacterium]|nr:GntR family transcriptional regulator [Alphaproteobacteria bacterium]
MPSPGTPIRRATLSVQIAERLKADILSGRHAPGSQLHEVELARAFDVSRGPLREAMQRLVQEGLLRSAPHRGVFVPEITEADILDLYFVRAVLEKAAARQVCGTDRHGTVAATLRDLADAMDLALSQGDHRGASELDFDYHRTLVDGAESERLSRSYATVQSETRFCLHYLMGGYRSPADLAEEHHRLAAVLATGDPDAVGAELDAHFGDPKRNLDRLNERERAMNGATEGSAQ